MKKFTYAVVTMVMFGVLSGCNKEPNSAEYIKSGQSYFEKQEWKSAIIEFKNAVKQTPDNAKARALLGKTYLETQSANAAVKELEQAIKLGYDRSELSVSLAMAYRQAGQNQKLIDDIKPTDNQTNTQQAIIYALRGIAYLALDDKSKAENALNKARKLDGEETEVRLAWATYEIVNGNPEAQERWLLPLLDRDGGNALAWSQMGELEQRRGNFDAADRAFTRAIEIRNTANYDYVRRALARIAAGNIEGAEADLEFLKKSGANWPMVSHAEGLIDFQAKKYAEAQAHFVDLLAKAPNFPPAQMMAGISYFYQQNYQSTIVYLEQYLGNVPNNTRAQLVYATALLAVKKNSKALEVLEALNSEVPNDYRVLSLLSDVYLREGKTVESLEALQKAVKINPDQANTRLQLGSSLIRNPDTAAVGQEELKKALELDPSLKAAKLNLFMSYLRGKQFEEAMTAAKEMDAAEPEQSVGANLVALVYLAGGDDDKAKQQLISTMERFPADVLTSHNLGRIYIREKNYEDARALYSKVIKEQPNHIQSLEQMALIAASEGNPEDMMQWLQKAVDRNPEQTRPKLILASQYLQQGNAAAATTVLNGVDVEAKQSVGYIILMARAKLGIREFDHAERLLKSLLKQQPNLAVGHFLLAQVYASQGDGKKMRVELNRTVELEPRHLMAQVFLAKLDLAEGNQKRFEARVADLEINYPGNLEVEVLRARQSSVNKDYDSAVKALSEVLAASPQPGVVMELARNQWQSGDRQGAISSLELWSQSKDDNRVLLLLAEFYLLEGRNEEATATYESLEKLLPDDPRVLNNLAWSLKDSNPDKGVEFARKAVELAPGNPLIMDTLAMLTLKAGDKVKALEISSEAVNKAPNVLDIQLNYAEILAANDKKDRARKVLEDILAKTKDPERKKMVNDRLKSL